MKIIDDIKAYSGKNPIRILYTLFLNTGFHMTFWYRVAHFFYKCHLSIISKIIMFFHKIIYSVDFDYRAKIGGGFKVVHSLGIVIGCDVVIGKNVTLYQGVTLGGNFGKTKVICGKETGQPYLHDGVKVFAHGMIFGPCEIGENAEIGAGTVVTKDVPANTRIYTKSEKVMVEIQQ